MFIKVRQPCFPVLLEIRVEKLHWTSHLFDYSGKSLLVLFIFFKEWSLSDWLVTCCVSGSQRDNRGALCRPRLAAPHTQGRARGQGSNVEMHLDGTESGLWGHHGVSAPFWSQSRGREEGNLHPKAVPAMLRAFRISLWPWEKLGRGRAAAGRRLAVFNALRLTSCQFTFALANPIYLILPKLSRLHFACLQRAFLLFWVTMCFVHPSSPNIGKDALQEAPKGAKCNKPSRYKKAKEDSDTQQLWRLNTKCTFHYSEPLLGRAFNEMTYLCGQQCFPFGLILPASFSHLSHCQPSSHSCTVV